MINITVSLDPEDKKLIEGHARLKSVSISSLIRDTMLEKIENELDLDLFNQTIQEYNKNPKSISFEDMLKELSD
ncbi:type II toxin-antitoxin system RelB family antitoxin [Alkalibacterium kapii]|uniref:CopG family transcriptional regulator n=1 Tax=Alkalibacterium kapii TaxID=426704 RepID=A0A511ATR9_9LACT|nr:DUF6290 family protein [Alkalibacterium kapii]GEK90723.1 CopG family transcriptional regulator [Alkalibacterium kapii]